MDNKLLLSLSKKFGTPLYVYDTSKISEQYNRLDGAFKGIKRMRINYAIKANPNLNILKILKNLGSGADAVSIQEVHLALKAGFSSNSIIFTPNGVSLQEIEEVSKLGVQINIDNISILEQFGTKYPDIPVCVRINPHIMAGGNRNISVGHIDSKFGISIYQKAHILRVVENTGLKINGLHMHTGSDILDIDAFLSAINILLETAKDFKDLDFIDFGSGFKVPYKEGDVETNIEELGEKLTKQFNLFCKEYGKELTLMFEPGKFMVSESGKFLAQVNVVKHSPSTVFAGVDSGFNHLIRPMMYNSYHHIHNISDTKGRERYYSVVGYICETDTFGSNRRISEISEGDILCFDNAGAYCFSMASNYNSRYKPAEVLIHKGKPFLIRERDTFEDLIKNQVEVDFDEV